MNVQTLTTDILILGAGGAGLFAALHAKKANPELDVTIAVKGLLGKCGCTRMVQGGYNVALSPGDSIERHFMDTIEGGGWLNDQDLAWLLVETAPGSGVGVGGDGEAGAPMDARDGAQDALDTGREPRLVGGALEDPGADAGPGDSLLDVVEEELVEHVHTRRTERGASVVEVVRKLAVGVETGGDHDVEVDLGGDLLHGLDVATETDHGEVDDGVDAGGLELLEALDGSPHLCVAVPPRWPIGGDFG